MPKLNGTSPYLAKDQRKSDLADKFIGRGSFRSSTNQYRIDWGILANSGSYTDEDIVFISAEGNRSNRVKPNYNEIDLAIAALASFITDDRLNRSRNYNIGEREVAAYLMANNYHEVEPGYWEPKV